MTADHSRSPSAYGVTERAIASDDLTLHVERITVSGYTVVPGRFSEPELDDLGTRSEMNFVRSWAASVSATSWAMM